MPREKEKKSGEESWLLWWNRVRACQRFREQYYFGDRKWIRYYDIYKMLMWEDYEDDTWDISSDNLPDKVIVPITTSTILTLIPFLVNETAKYHLQAKKPSDVVNALLKQEVLNYEFKRKELQVYLKRSIYDGIIIGHGIAKTGFTRTVDEAKSKRAGDIEYDDLIDDESIYSRRIDPFNFWFDYSAPDKDLKTARFTIERYWKYLPDVIENPIYKSSVRDKLDSGDYVPIMVSSLNSVYKMNDDSGWLKDYAFPTYESEMMVMYEIWDKKYNQVITLAEGIPEPLRVIDNPYPYLQGEFPYVKIDFIYRPNEFYGMGIPEFVEHQQLELNRHRTYGFHHRRRFSARKLQVLKDAVDVEDIENLPDMEDGEYILVNQQDAIKPIEDVPLPRDYPLIEALIKQDIVELTGADALARGSNLQSRATLGEVQVRSNILSLKLNERVAEVDRFFLNVGKQLSSHIGGNYTKSRIIKLEGLQGEYWVEVNDEDLKDEVDVTMETVSAPKRNPELEAQQRIQMFQFSMQLLPLIQAGLIPKEAINFVELLKWALEGFERVDIGRFFPAALSPQSPLQEQTGQVLPSSQIQGQPQGTGNPQDLIRSLASGNTAGLQVAGVG